MIRYRTSILLVIGLVAGRAASAQGGQGSGNSALDHAIRAFYEAKDNRELRSAKSDIASLESNPDSVWQRMSQGSAFSPRVSKGRLNLDHRTQDGEDHHYILVVPSTYNPAVPSSLRIYLHGGVETEDKNIGARWDFDRFASPDGIAVYPSAWRGAMWWRANQLENILGIIEDLKRTYNVDENRIHVIGVSDGGTGAFFLAFKTPTPFASFLPLIGSAAVLVNPRLGAEGPFYVPNLRNAPLFMVNGALDPLYSVRDVAPYVALYRQAGVNVTFHPRAETGHDLRWWAEESASIDSFVAAHPRNPFPDRISWETERTDRFNRAFWLTIDSLGPTEGETNFPALDSVVPLRPEPSLGVRADPTSRDGVRLLSVELGSLAGAAGLLAGDRIVGVNGTATPTLRALLEASQGLGWDDSMHVTFERGGTQRRIIVVLGPRPDTTAVGPVLAFPRPRPTGRVELIRTGNQVEVKTHGVRRFTLLLSPSQFNLDQPITVITNGKVSFEGLVPKSVDTLLRWASLDRDRTMLYLGELSVTP
ncbi:MAG: hypothetical protein ABI679_15465 [Gemmatimonadota bacterium]